MSGDTGMDIDTNARTPQTVDAQAGSAQSTAGETHPQTGAEAASAAAPKEAPKKEFPRADKRLQDRIDELTKTMGENQPEHDPRNPEGFTADNQQELAILLVAAQQLKEGNAIPAQTVFESYYKIQTLRQKLIVLATPTPQEDTGHQASSAQELNRRVQQKQTETDFKDAAERENQERQVLQGVLEELGVSGERIRTITTECDEKSIETFTTCTEALGNSNLTDLIRKAFIEKDAGAKAQLQRAIEQTTGKSTSLPEAEQGQIATLKGEIESLRTEMDKMTADQKALIEANQDLIARKEEQLGEYAASQKANLLHELMSVTQIGGGVGLALLEYFTNELLKISIEQLQKA